MYACRYGDGCSEHSNQTAMCPCHDSRYVMAIPFRVASSRMSSCTCERWMLLLRGCFVWWQGFPLEGKATQCRCSCFVDCMVPMAFFWRCGVTATSGREGPPTGLNRLDSVATARADELILETEDGATDIVEVVAAHDRDDEPERESAWFGQRPVPKWQLLTEWRMLQMIGWTGRADPQSGSD